ncbi:hypothetical protein B0J18DRAFT_366513 [Chaetomium sp. MPI-SDFR-AT-0129]|nr:hypothetical protein B0J18DRAFT_366513 [Chaetomium sp. MPI-SDFR-AT-0129]
MAGLDIYYGASTTSSDPAILDGTQREEEGAVENGPAPRLKRTRGRDRLLRGLQRIASSPSLTRAGRTQSSNSPYSLSSTFSCVSLSSTGSPFGQFSDDGFYFSRASSPSAGGMSGAQTSIPASPITGSLSQGGPRSSPAVRPVGAAFVVPTTAFVPYNVRKRAAIFSIWAGFPREVKVHVLSFLRPKELVRVSRVSREFHSLCFDGQLWTSLDASEFYQKIPAESLAKIVVSAGPFMRDLNLRGCIQVEHHQRAEIVVEACRNLVNATLEGCRNFKRSTLHTLLKTNNRLAHINLTGLSAVSNATCKIVANSCPQLEVLNVSWCKHMDARGVRFVVESCPRLRDLRAGEVKGFNLPDVATAIFRTNNLERLVLSGCDDLTDDSLQLMVHGPEPEIDYLTDRPMVPPRNLRHLDLTRCSRLTDDGVKALGHFVPRLEGLQLSGVSALTDAALEPILASTPLLTHLELEDLPQLTDRLFSQHLAKAPCAPRLKHLSISYCENVGDVGMLPVLKTCTRLRSVYMDNTLISDLSLTEAAAMVRQRGATAVADGKVAVGALPKVTLRLVAYDCPAVTWAGVREVLNRNTTALPTPAAALTTEPTEVEVEGEGVKDESMVTVSAISSPPGSASSSSTSSTASLSAQPPEIISLRCFYSYQMTVDEHLKRVLEGDPAGARELERKWAEFIQASQEVGAAVGGGAAAAVARRRRRRRAREAQAILQAAQGESLVGGLFDAVIGGGNQAGGTGVVGGGRRRARAMACAVM